MNLLHVDSSILGDNSVSRKISAAAVAALRAAHPDLTITYRDLAAEPPPHLTGAMFAARFSPPEAADADAATASAILDEFLAADVVVLGAPMYNFGIASQLKSWVDHLAVAGRTFRYTEKGVEGLAGGKRLIIASSRGGYYGPESPAAALQHQESYLRGLFAFLGVTDIEVVGAEGVNVGPEQRASALEAALGDAHRLVAVAA